MSWSRSSQWLACVQDWVAARPTAAHPEGLAHVREALVAALRELGFEFEIHAAEGVQPIVVARRAGRGDRWLGIVSHYDVEEASGGEWRSDPWTLVEREGRHYGRGLADNLGPLAQRLLSLRDLPAEQGAGIVWVIEGEEEIGSPFAARLYPRLALPEVALWLEETGYFYKDGRQRVLARGSERIVAPLVAELRTLALSAGREMTLRGRFLNKAFGQDRCPALRWLVGKRAYLAIGPNDDWTRVHAPNESLDPSLLELCDRQFRRVVEVLA